VKVDEEKEKSTSELFEDDILYRLCESLIGSLDDGSE
jgi:hypothetical protein